MRMSLTFIAFVLFAIVDHAGHRRGSLALSDDAVRAGEPERGAESKPGRSGEAVSSSAGHLSYLLPVCAQLDAFRLSVLLPCLGPHLAHRG
jgi:hypothetical protein